MEFSNLRRRNLRSINEFSWKIKSCSSLFQKSKSMWMFSSKNMVRATSSLWTWTPTFSDSLPKYFRNCSLIICKSLPRLEALEASRNHKQTQPYFKLLLIRLPLLTTFIKIPTTQINQGWPAIRRHQVLSIKQQVEFSPTLPSRKGLPRSIKEMIPEDSMWLRVIKIPSCLLSSGKISGRPTNLDRRVEIWLQLKA